MDKEWEYVIRERLPMNEWGEHLEKKLLEWVGK